MIFDDFEMPAAAEEIDKIIERLLMPPPCPPASARVYDNVRGSVESLPNASGSSLDTSGQSNSSWSSHCSTCSCFSLSPRNSNSKSVLKFNNKSLMPPLLCPTTRDQMKLFRDQACAKEESRKIKEKQRLITRVEAILSLVQFTPKKETMNKLQNQQVAVEETIPVLTAQTNQATSSSSDDDITTSTVVEVKQIKAKINQSIDGVAEQLVSGALTSAKKQIAEDLNISQLPSCDLECDKELKNTSINVSLTENIDILSPIQLQIQGKIIDHNETLNQSTSTKLCAQEAGGVGAFETIPMSGNKKINTSNELPSTSINLEVDGTIIEMQSEIAKSGQLSTSEEDTTIAESCSVPMGTTTTSSDITMLQGHITSNCSDNTITSQVPTIKDDDETENLTIVNAQEVEHSHTNIVKESTPSPTKRPISRHVRRGSYTVETPSPYLLAMKDVLKPVEDGSSDAEESFQINSVNRKLEITSDSEESSISRSTKSEEIIELRSRLHLIHKKQLKQLQKKHQSQLNAMQTKLLQNRSNSMNAISSPADDDNQSIISEDSLLPRSVKKDVSFLQLPSIKLHPSPPPIAGGDSPVIDIYSPLQEQINLQRPNHRDSQLSQSTKIPHSVHIGFCKLSALVKGHLTRALLTSNKVKGIIQTIRDTSRLILSMQDDDDKPTTNNNETHPVDHAFKSMEDEQLRQRLFSQLRGQLYEIHNVFFKSSVSYRISLISHTRTVSRQQMNTSLPTKTSPRTLSAATRKSMERKKLQAESTSRPTSAKPIAEVQSKISHIWKDPIQHVAAKNIHKRPASRTTVTKSKSDANKIATEVQKSRMNRKKAPLATRRAVSLQN